MSDIERFLSHVDTGAGCWIWRGQTTNGYGRFSVGQRNFYAHRFSFEFFNGPIPDGYEVDHLCMERRCVRPFHLEAVTAHENNMRSDSRAAQNARRKHCLHGHPLSGDNLSIVVSAGVRRRRCRECARTRTREWKERQGV